MEKACGNILLPIKKKAPKKEEVVSEEESEKWVWIIYVLCKPF